jgi:hypothetical protein
MKKFKPYLVIIVVALVGMAIAFRVAPLRKLVTGQ